jgi:cytidyltransferase-like protein
MAKKVLVFGTFDIFHEGHRHFLAEAKKEGDQLTVVVAQDSNVLKIKGKYPVHGLHERIRSVKGSGLADEVLAGGESDPLSIVETVSPDIICLGYDQDSLGLESLIEKRLRDIKIIRLKPYKEDKFKSSLLRDGFF